MRSLIQLAGRVQRHRQLKPEKANLLILSQNFRSLKGIFPAYTKPGFESSTMSLASHDLSNIIQPEQYEEINSAPKVQFIPCKDDKNEHGYLNLSQLEHYAMFKKLLGFDGEENHAGRWWQHEISWCGELQRRQPFRKSLPDEPYCLFLSDKESKPAWKIKNENVTPYEYARIGNIHIIDNLELCGGNQFWLDINPGSIYTKLSDKLSLPLDQISKFFGELRLRTYKNQVADWNYHPLLGVYQELEGEK